jgi:ribosomal-protein-alanine N-acetyltransferase
MIRINGVVIQTPTLRDSEELYRIEKECFAEEAFTRQQILNLISSYNSISLVAKANRALLGFVVGAIYYERKELVGHILTVDISENFRRKGVASTLLTRMEAMLREQGVAACRLEVKEDNAAGIGLYEKLGYKMLAKLQSYYGKTNGLYFRKSLTQV